MPFKKVTKSVRKPKKAKPRGADVVAEFDENPLAVLTGYVNDALGLAYRLGIGCFTTTPMGEDDVVLGIAVLCTEPATAARIRALLETIALERDREELDGLGAGAEVA